MRHAAVPDAHRLTARWHSVLGAGLAVMLALLVIGGTAGPAGAAQLTGGPVCSSGYVYSVQSDGHIIQVAGANTSSPTATTYDGWSTLANLPTAVNGLAIAANGSAMYAYTRAGSASQDVDSILSWSASTGSWTRTQLSYKTGNTSSLVTGAVNLATGKFLFAGTNYPTTGTYANQWVYALYQYDPATQAITNLGFVPTGITASDANNNGDMAFDAAGNLFLVRSGSPGSGAASTTNIYSVTAADLAAAEAHPGNAINAASSTPGAISITAVNGMAFDADGSVYLGNTSQLARYDPTSWAQLTPAANLLGGSSTDLASCNSPATLTIRKNVVGRATATDQFTLNLAKAGATIGSTTTSGSANGVQAKQLTLPVLAGSTYQFSELMAAGSGSALSDYSTSWSCTGAGGSGTGTSGSVTIPLPAAGQAGTAVVCTLSNTPAAQSVLVNKLWSIADAAGHPIGTFHVPAQAGDTANALPAGFGATATVNGTDVTWGVASTGYSLGQSVSINERAITVPPGCTVASSTVTSANGAAVSAALPYSSTLVRNPSPNTYTITNAVTCTQNLTLVKKVDVGSAAVTAWTLSATGPAGTLAGPNGASGTSAATAALTPGASYALAESGGPNVYVPTAAGWQCVASTGTVTPAGGAVSLAYGQSATCTITNTTAQITVLKHISGTGLTASQFTLKLVPSDNTLPAQNSIAGSETTAAANTFEVKPGTKYTLSETSVAANLPYLALGLQISTDGTTWTDVASTDVTVPAGQHVYYRFVNQSVPAPMLPLTGGIGADSIWIGGGGLLLLGLALMALWQIHRVRAARR
ncbi:hypothetical protein [Psychromicrobium xiongbiense]|uniref:hypothetical protein n=1 Tax=Psychromicrobium xiongbiense TaxID=3051184 RepID=UPI002552DA81|nr:hypothetical protein [Psychromicrobium sp. YIM S02556]